MPAPRARTNYHFCTGDGINSGDAGLDNPADGAFVLGLRSRSPRSSTGSSGTVAASEQLLGTAASVATSSTSQPSDVRRGRAITSAALSLVAVDLPPLSPRRPVGVSTRATVGGTETTGARSTTIT